MSAQQNHWTIEGLPWDALDPSKVDADLLKIIKAAALVEYGAESYADYLCRIFHDDKDFQDVARRWAVEEVQHGKALGTWAEKIDPSWSLETAMDKFRKGYTPEHFMDDDAISVRGSRSGEMVARCMVETGTSSYYTAIADSIEEPVLQKICRLIAADEFRHYKLFYDTLNRYLAKENLSRPARLKIALGRIAESEDDELSYAYFAANANDNDVYDRKTYNKAYMQRAYSYYQFKHTDRIVGMVFKACGFKPHTLPHKIATKLAWWRINGEVKRMKKLAA
ncbi:MAG: ferritin-like domain-containing protein [Rhodospirillales bacterium]|nr:ferritin-like domain-containing protein [Rhodospirillales bacterium]MCB9997237.1 ferritin-like domain-containing protein [Rhodospirillales bacterium]